MVYVQNPLACTGPSTWTTSPPAATFPYYHNKTSPKQGTPPDTQRNRFREEQTRRPRQQERTRVHDLACTDFTTGITTKSPSLTQVSHTTGTPPLRIPYTHRTRDPRPPHQQHTPPRAAVQAGDQRPQDRKAGRTNHAPTPVPKHSQPSTHTHGSTPSRTEQTPRSPNRPQARSTPALTVPQFTHPRVADTPSTRLCCNHR